MRKAWRVEGGSVTDFPDNGTPSLSIWAGGRSRVILAITFTDIVDSTRLARELGDQAMRAVREAHFDQSRRLIAANDGRWVKSLGDGDLAVFSTAEAALDYALALQADPGHPVLASRVRAGIHLGVVDMTVADIHGNAVNFAARVSSATKAAEIWLSTQAIDHLIDLKAEHHATLHWQEHPGIALKGFEGTHTLWSLAPAGSGRVLWEFPARGPSPLPLAESNIPEGMVPRHFLGREEALSDLSAALESGRGRVAITALHGLRGVGKTVLAAAYAERHRADYRATWWVRAETESGLRADLVGLAMRLGWVAPDEKEEPALAAVTERLRQEATASC
jgi:class 3 adenylate cyclase